MKKILFSLAFIVFSFSANAQFVSAPNEKKLSISLGTNFNPLFGDISLSYTQRMGESNFYISGEAVYALENYTNNDLRIDKSLLIGNAKLLYNLYPLYAEFSNQFLTRMILYPSIGYSFAYLSNDINDKINYTIKQGEGSVILNGFNYGLTAEYVLTNTVHLFLSSTNYFFLNTTKTNQTRSAIGLGVSFIF